MRRFLTKYRELIVYGIVGALNTVLNFGSFYILETVAGVNYLVSDVIAWILSFAFSFVANKIYVFQSKGWERTSVLKELGLFFCCSVGTGILDVLMLFCMVDLMHIDETLAKVIDVVVVIVINYFVRKFWVFRKRKQE